MVVIKGGRIVDPANMDGIADIYIDSGKIKAVGQNIYVEGAKVIDASGKAVVPGFIDVHVHLREPGYEHKETIRTGTMAAAMGGFTTVACMPNTKPVIHSREIVQYILKRARLSGLVNVLPIGSITVNIEGKELTPIEELVEAGVVAISDDGKTAMDTRLMEIAFKKAKELNIPLIDHCEDHSLAAGGSINQGAAEKRTGLKGIPNSSEWSIVARDIILAKTYKTHIHIAHVSTKESIDLIRKAKKEGINITTEVCPHHFTLSDELIEKNNTYTKVNPPLRSTEDVKAVIEGIADGTIDIIATDHAPHDEESKAVNYEDAAFGISGLETAFQVSYSELVCKKIISLNRLIEMMSTNPAKILNLDKGSLRVGKDADIALLDLETQDTIDRTKFVSMGKNTPFHGKTVTGKVVATMVEGGMIMEGGILNVHR